MTGERNEYGLMTRLQRRVSSPSVVDTTDISLLCAEAAQEIERLRTALTDIFAITCGIDTLYTIEDAMKRIQFHPAIQRAAVVTLSGGAPTDG